MRVAVVDIGTNSTRLLVADVERRPRRASSSAARPSRASARASTRRASWPHEAMDRVLAALRRVPRGDRRARRRSERRRPHERRARRGATAPPSPRAVRERFGLDARTIAGDEEARLTFLGATSERPPTTPTPTVVIDIGGGSTEFVVGAGGRGRLPRLHPGRRRAPDRAPPAPRPARARRAARAARGRPRDHRRGGRRRRPRRGRGGHRRRGHRHVARRDRPGARALRPRARARLPSAARPRRAAPRRAWPR